MELSVSGYEALRDNTEASVGQTSPEVLRLKRQRNLAGAHIARLQENSGEIYLPIIANIFNLITPDTVVPRRCIYFTAH